MLFAFCNKGDKMQGVSFWSGMSSTSQIGTVLDKEDVTLTELLEQDDIIQECKSQNKKLVDFLTKPDIVIELINLILNEPPKDGDGAANFKFPYIAAEIFSCEIPQLTMTISGDESLLDKLYSVMESESEINPLLASYMTKAFSGLIFRTSEQNWYNHQVTYVQVIEFLQKKDFVVHALRHISTSAIPDLILSLVTCADGMKIKTSLLEWLNEKELVQSIVRLMDPKLERDTHDNASRLFIEILRVSRDGQQAAQGQRCEDPILETLESSETVSLLLDVIFGRKDGETPPDSVIVNGISILLALLERRQASSSTTFGANFGMNDVSVMTSSDFSPKELAEQEAVLNATLQSILPSLEDFTKLLTNPPNTKPLATSAGVLDPPLGPARLSVAKLICAILATNNKDANLKLTELNAVNVLLDLFFKYSLNNFLHAQVERCIRLVFSWNNSTGNPEHPNRTMSPTTSGVKTPPTVEMVEPMADNATDSQSAPVDSSESTKNDVDEGGRVGDDAVVEKPVEQSPVPDKDTYENPLLVGLYSNCRLVERVLEAWEENDIEEGQRGVCRKGYMGHLTQIANTMHQYMSGNSKCHDVIATEFSKLDDDTRTKWDEFVLGKLAEVNAKNIIVPVSAYATHKRSMSEGDDSDFGPLEYPQSDLHETFSDYQMQQMSENFVDTFGFSKNDWSTGHDSSDDSGGELGRLSSVLSDDTAGSSPNSASKRAEEMFEAVCEQRFTNFPGGFDGDDDSDDEIIDHEAEDTDDPWADKTKEINFNTSSSLKSPINSDAHNNSSSAEGEDANATSTDSESAAKKAKSSIDNQMDVDEDVDDNGLDVYVDGSSKTAVVMDTGNPWESEPSASSIEGHVINTGNDATNAEGWANFERVQSVENAESEVKSNSSRFDVTSVDDTTKKTPDETLTQAPPVVQTQ